MSDKNQAIQIRDIPPPDIQIIKETAAAQLARYVVVGFFGILGFAVFLLFVEITIATMQGISLANLESLVNVTLDLIKTLAAVLAGIIGAVLGYYFRDRSS